MLNRDLLTELLARPELPRREAILSILATEIDQPKAITEIKKIGKQYGLRSIENWNVADILIRSKGLCTKLKDGWVLTPTGSRIVSELVPNQTPHVRNISSVLRQLIEGIKDSDTQQFLTEAAFCFDSGCYRAAIVLSWVGAVSILHDFIVTYKLNEFNQEAIRRNPKWQNAKNSDDLSRMKEKDFLDVLSTTFCYWQEC